MRRTLIAAAVMVAGVLGSAVVLRSTTPFPATSGCPHDDSHVALCYDLQLYYNAIQANLFGAADAVPDDQFFKPAPGVSATRGETSSVGAEVIHAAETQSRMCTLLNYHNHDFEWEKEWEKDPAKLSGANVHTKTEAIALLHKSFDECDPFFKNIRQNDLNTLYTGNHGPKPLATTLFNAISHDREVYGRILSFMAAEGLKAPGETQALTPKEKSIEDAAAAAARANRPAGGAGGGAANQ